MDCQQGVERQPDVINLLKEANRLRSSGHFNEAARICSQFLVHNPDHSAAMHMLGVLQWEQGNSSEGIILVKKAIAADSSQPTYYNTLGVILMDAGLYSEAAGYLQKALDISPEFHDARCNLGLSLFKQQKVLSAVEHFQQVLAACQDHKETLANLGLSRLVQGDFSAAIESYEKAITIDHQQPSWWGNLGAAYLKLECFEDAARCFKQALSLDPQNVSHYIQSAVTSRAKGDLESSIKLLQSSLSIDPNNSESIADLSIALQQTCQWSELGLFTHRMDQSTRKALNDGKTPAEQPMTNIRRTSDLCLNLAVARSWGRKAEQRALRTAVPYSHSPGGQSEKHITLGYLSYDFRDHPVAHQMLPLFRLHDRNRFKVVAFSFGPDDNSVYRRKIQNDCDRFFDIRTAGIAKAAELIHDQKVDILIDLMGHTHHNRMEILALRPSPIQVGYLGFLASSGADFIDYLIADPVVVPEAHSRYYQEKLIRMPYCYQINHPNMLSKEAPPARRKDYGLPEKSFVFCCFNRAYKIDPLIFETWMRILKRVPESVLWLYHGNPIAVDQLRKATQRCGVDPARLIFAGKISLAEHLTRLQLADLALDTATYNGGATTSNALLASLPVLAMLGGHWVSRMTASHLLAAGLPELVADDLHAYENKAVALAHSPQQMQALRTKLKHNLSTSPLFDPQGFVNQLETAFEVISTRFEKGLSPEHIFLPPASDSRLKNKNIKESSMVQMPEVNISPTCENNYTPNLDPFADIEKEFTPEGLFALAVWYQSCEKVDKAIAIYKKAIHIAPRFAEAYYNLGVLHYHKDDWPNATRYFKKALDLKPDSVDAAYNLAMSLKVEEKYEQAAAAYQVALELNPKLYKAHYFQGLCYLNSGDCSRAAKSFKKSTDFEPDNAMAWFYLAAAIQKTVSMDELLHCYRKSVELKPDWDAAHHNLSVALGKKQRLQEGIRHSKRALELSPHFAQAREHLFRLAQHACDWQLMDKVAEQLDRLTHEELSKGIKTTEAPMINIRRHSNPQMNLNVACSWSRQITQDVAALPHRPIFEHLRTPSKRIRIGYLSSDFKDHAVAHQIRGMLAAHDRQRFEIYGYACNTDDGTQYRRLLSQACDHFRDIHNLSDEKAARLIHKDNIQILVDMAGHSQNSRMHITAMRPAPVQVSYLGFLSSTGADFIDYVIADAIVVPEHHKKYYTEKVVYLPHCYQANDDLMPIADRKYSRSNFNLPDKAMVYASFNLPYKIDARLFNTWMNILKQVDGSVLWLVERSQLARENLCLAAASAQVDPARLVFTGFTPIAQNLARLQLADLALDTRIYNGGATTANALWAGIPVLAQLGNHWVSRMTASAMHAVGMPELVASNLNEYEQMAVSLGRNPLKLKALHDKLAVNRLKAPLFNTQLFTKHMETTYEKMLQRHCDGLQPASFEVQP